MDRDSPPSFEAANLIVTQASIVLPFDSRTAYFAFSDFTRHPEWNPQLTKVEYVDSKENEVRWTMESYGIEFGWSTVAVKKELNRLLVWQSVKGLQLQGRAEFENLDDGQSRMMFTLCYVAPRKVKNTLGNSKKESPHIKLMLESFRDAVAKDCH